jgi:TolB-like protein
MIAAAVGAAVLAAALLRPPRRTADADEPKYDPRRIAVLYFDDDSPGGELEYLASGLTGELIDELSQVPALEVVSRNAVKAYRDGVVSLDSLVAELQVGSVVEGSVQRSGDSVRVRVELVDPHRRLHLESRTIVRPLNDLFALEAAVGEEVSAFLRRRLGEEVRLRQTRAETRSSEALGLVLRAEQARDESARLARRGHPLDAASAVRLLAGTDSLLARAEAADSRWARPTVLRGQVAIALTALSPNQAQVPLLRAAVGHADRVLAREPRNASALALRGRARWRLAVAGGVAGQARELGNAEADLRAALAADSTLAPAWSALSLLLRFRGRFAESDLAARRALDQDAYLEDAAEILQRLYFGAMSQGDYAGARPLCARGHTLFPGDWRFVECRLTLLREDPSLPADPARAWFLAAELDRLDPPAAARDAGRPYSPLYRRAAVAAVLARAGAADSARAVLGRLRGQAAASDELRLPLLYDEAYVLLLLGDRAGARRLLDRYLAARPSFRAYVARDVLFRDLFAAPPAPR